MNLPRSKLSVAKFWYWGEFGHNVNINNTLIYEKEKACPVRIFDEQ
jgi:hypothetical protein